MRTVRGATPEDVGAILALIEDRIRGMDERGLRQWNETNYLEVYPRWYFEENTGSFFVLQEGERIIAAVAAYREDERWPRDGRRALYLHHLASDTAARGAGSELLERMERHAAEQGVDVMRLDSDVNNEKLEAFYARRGYRPRGTCVDGPYVGTLREKALAKAPD